VGEGTLALLKEEMPFTVFSLPLPAAVVDVLVSSGACESKGEAKRLVRQGGVSVNETRVEDEGRAVGQEELLYGKYLFIRLGKKRFHLAEIL
jgi:tyrosyl-tRNA synthetase